MLPKVAYRQVVKGLEHYRKQDEDDRCENPTRIPIDWHSVLVSFVERIARENHVKMYRGLTDEVLQNLAKQGLLVPYHGGYAFPGRALPSVETIKQAANEDIKRLLS